MTRQRSFNQDEMNFIMLGWRHICETYEQLNDEEERRYLLEHDVRDGSCAVYIPESGAGESERCTAVFTNVQANVYMLVGALVTFTTDFDDLVKLNKIIRMLRHEEEEVL